MRGMFSMDSPLMNVLTKVADLILINIMFLVVSIPIVTIGAGYTAMYSVCMKLVKDEEGSVTKQFLKAFKENFKQATIMWVPMLVIAAGLIIDYIVVKRGASPKSFETIIYVLAAIWAILFINIFPLIAKFENSILNTIRNALVVAFVHIVKTVFMALFVIVPWVLTYRKIEIFPVFAMLGCSVPVFINSIWFNKIYDEMIENYNNRNEDSLTEEQDNNEKEIDDEETNN